MEVAIDYIDLDPAAFQKLHDVGDVLLAASFQLHVHQKR